MGKYQIAKEAREDLIKIQRYTQEHWGITQSDKYLAEIFKLFSLGAIHPEIGRSVAFRDDVFRFPHKSHVAYFLKKSSGIIFISVMHKSQLPEDYPALSLHEPEVVFTLTTVK